MSSLQDQLKEIEDKEESQRPVFNRLSKLNSALDDIELVSGFLSFAIVVGFFIILYKYIIPHPNENLAIFLTFYGGLALVVLLHTKVINPLLKSFIYFLYKINKKDHKSIAELKEDLQNKKYEIQRQINEANKKIFWEKERKLIEQLDSLVGLAKKGQLPTEKIEEIKEYLASELIEIRNFGYQIHTSIYYNNRFEKINQTLLSSNDDPASTSVKSSNSLPNSRQIHTTFSKPDLAEKQPESEINIIPSIDKVTTSPVISTPKPIPKEEEKTSSELFSVSNQEVENQESIKNYQPGPLVKVDFSKLNEHRHNIGELGELYIFEKEQRYFVSQGKINQSKAIIHVSLNDDSAGYDIISYTDSDERKYIEVKTTTGNEFEPFFLSNSEMEAMKRLNNYWIYRVFNFNIDLKKGDLYKIDCKKDFSNYYSIQPSSFKVTPNKR